MADILVFLCTQPGSGESYMCWNPWCVDSSRGKCSCGGNYINNELHSYIWCFTGTQNALHRRGMPHSLPLCSSHLSNSTTAIFHRQPRHHRLGVLPDYKSLIVVQLTNHRTRCTLESGTETWRSEEEYVFSWSRRMELSAQTSLHHVSVCEGEEQHPMAQISQTGRNAVCFHHQMVSQHTVVCVTIQTNMNALLSFWLSLKVKMWWSTVLRWSPNWRPGPRRVQGQTPAPSKGRAARKARRRGSRGPAQSHKGPHITVQFTVRN